LKGRKPRLIDAPARLITPVVQAAHPETVKPKNDPVKPPVIPPVVIASDKRPKFNPIRADVINVVTKMIVSTEEEYPKTKEGIREIKADVFSENRYEEISEKLDKVVSKV